MIHKLYFILVSLMIYFVNELKVRIAIRISWNWKTWNLLQFHFDIWSGAWYGFQIDTFDWLRAASCKHQIEIQPEWSRVRWNIFWQYSSRRSSCWGLLNWLNCIVERRVVFNMSIYNHHWFIWTRINQVLSSSRSSGNIRVTRCCRPGRSFGEFREIWWSGWKACSMSSCEFDH